MALNELVGSFLWSGSDTIGTTYTIDLGTGFDPKYILFWMAGSGSATDAVANADEDLSVGFATGTASRRGVAAFSDHGSGNSVCHRTHRDDGVLFRVRGSGLAAALDVTTWADDEIVLTVDTTQAINQRVHYKIRGGDDIPAAGIVDIVSPIATGLQTVSTPGVDPDLALFLSAGFAIDFQTPPTPPAMNTVNTQGSLMFGAASDGAAGENAVTHTHSRHGRATSDTFCYCLDGESIAAMNASGSVFERAKVDSFGTGEFDLDWLAVVDFASTLISALVVEGSQAHVEGFTTLDTTGDIALTGPDFDPSSVLVSSGLGPESTPGTSDAGAAFSLGAWDGTNQGAQAVLDRDNLADTDVTVAIDFDKVYIDLSSGTVDGLIAGKTLDTGGYTLEQTDADPSANFAWGIALGPAAAGGGTTERSYAGSITMTGTSSKGAQMLVSGSLTPTGARVSRADVIRSGSVQPAGTATKTPGAVRVGSVTMVGVQTKEARTLADGSVTPAGTVSKEARVSRSGSVTPAGTSVKRAGRAYDGSSQPAGAFVKRAGGVYAGAISCAGAYAKRAAVLRSGSAGPSGAYAKLVARAIDGSLTPAGVFAATRVLVHAFAGSLTFAGHYTKRALARAAGSVTFSGSESKRVSRTGSGSMTPTGGFVKQAARSFAGSVTAAGAWVRSKAAGALLPLITHPLVARFLSPKRRAEFTSPNRRADFVKPGRKADVS